jgi:hypothetical protein
MGRRFHAMSPHKFLGDYDGEAVARVLRFLIENPAGLVLTNGDGVIGGMMAPIFYQPGKLMMEESFWWADRGGRDLLRAFTEEAKAMGAACVLLSTLENQKSEIVHRIVSRMGFAPVERRYVKDLT